MKTKDVNKTPIKIYKSKVDVRKGWEEEVNRAYLRAAEVIDLDQYPPVRYRSIYCKQARSIIDDLVDAHNVELQKQADQLNHDHEILVNTILETKNQELQKQKEEILEEIEARLIFDMENSTHIVTDELEVKSIDYRTMVRDAIKNMKDDIIKKLEGK